VWKGVSGTIAHVPAQWIGVCSVQTNGKGCDPFTPQVESVSTDIGSQDVLIISEQTLDERQRVFIETEGGRQITSLHPHTMIIPEADL